MAPSAITRKTLAEILGQMDEKAASLGYKQTLCLFGAAAILLYGSNERQTQDIDVWRAASTLNDRAIAQIAEAAELDLNPTDIDPDRIYLQIVSEGVVRLPAFDHGTNLWSNGKPNEILWQGNALTIVAPPPEIVAAAKMIRGEPQDIEDVLFLMASKGVADKDIRKALSSFPVDVRARGQENMVLLAATRSAKMQQPGKATRKTSDGWGK